MDLTKEFSKIDAYLFKYTPQAQEMYPNGQHAIDDKTHVGVMAQELQQNPATESVVESDENGYLMIDTRQLTMTLTALCSELSKKIDTLEKEVSELKCRMEGN